MKFQRLSAKEADAEAARRGWSVESNQNGIQRVRIGDVLIDSGSAYANLEISVPAPPEKVEKFRLVCLTPWGTEAALGDFGSEFDAVNRALDLALEERFRRVDKVLVPEEVTP